MEVCGGHTHSIFRYGIEGMLPPAIELVHGPGCPVCVLPMGRIDDAVAIAERPEVIFTTFGDAMRVPGSKKSLMQAKADGADMRMVYSPMDALALAREEPRARGRVLRPRVRDDDAVDGAHRAAGRARGHRQFLGLLQPHHDRADDQGHARQPRHQLDGFLGPGHVSMVIGTAPYEFVAGHYRQPLVVAGFEPLDILQSIWMVLRSSAEGRAEVENQYARIVPDGGNAPALRRGGARSTSCANSSNGAGSVRSIIPACACARAYARFDAERKFALPERPGSPIRNRASAARC